MIYFSHTTTATVANDILNEVLKGGEILKIRGLCKVHPNSSSNSKYTIDQPQQQTIHANYQPYKLIENGSSSTSVNASPQKSNKSTPRNSIDKSIHADVRNSSSTLGHHHHHILTQNESPVVVMSTSTSSSSQPNPPQNYAQSMTNNNNTNHQQQQQQLQQSNNLIIVKKDMAIDPGDATNNIPVEHYGLISLKIAAAVKKAQQQNNSSAKKSPTNITSSSSSTAVALAEQQRNREFYQIDDNMRYDAISSPPAFKVYTTTPSSSSSGDNLQQQIQQHMSEDALRYTEKKKRIAQNQKPSSSGSSNGGGGGGNGIRESSKSNNNNKFTTSENGQSFQMAATVTQYEKNQQQQQQQQHHHFPEALSFLTIKEEPIEWTEYDANGIASQVGDNRTEIITVKPETLEDIENSLSSEVNDKVYHKLTCEICDLKFQIPGAWVRHIESHSELNQAQQSIPKKRKRAEEVCDKK